MGKNYLEYVLMRENKGFKVSLKDMVIYKFMIY